MPRPKQRTPELRDRLITAAVAVLEEEGVGGLTTRKVAHDAATSTPAVYELFGDKAGLVRGVFFEGFRLLGERLDALRSGADPRRDLLRVVAVLRRFIADNPVLAEVMFSRPFADFDPGRDELAAGARVRRCIESRVRRCMEAGVLAGDETDAGHVLLAVVHGLAAQERAGLLGTSKASVDRRWRLAVEAVLRGLAPPVASNSR